MTAEESEAMREAIRTGYVPHRGPGNGHGLGCADGQDCARMLIGEFHALDRGQDASMNGPLLALDLGGTTGYCIGPLVLIGNVTGTWDIRPRRGESPGMRYLHLRAKLQEVRAAYPDLALVAYEQAHYRGGAATAAGAGSEAMVLAWCAEHGIEHVAVHSATLKKWATGKGNAGKPEMVKAAKKRGLLSDSGDDNEADAYLVYRYTVERVLGEARQPGSGLGPHAPGAGVLPGGQGHGTGSNAETVRRPQNAGPRAPLNPGDALQQELKRDVVRLQKERRRLAEQGQDR